jgi:hypothetical protein
LCDIFLLDLSSSTGNGGRAWGKVSISVQNDRNINNNILQDFHDYINGITLPIVIPSFLLSNETSYNFNFYFVISWPMSKWFTLYKGYYFFLSILILSPIILKKGIGLLG